MAQGIKVKRAANADSVINNEYFALCSQILDICSYVTTGTLDGNCDTCPKTKECHALYNKYMLQSPERYMSPRNVILFIREFGLLLRTMMGEQ